MAIGEALLPEFDHEMATTRRVLERVPDDKFAWKPHAKSMSMGDLARHLSDLPQMAGMVLTQPGFDLASRPAADPASRPATRAALLEAFDGHVKAAREAIASKTDPEFAAIWSLKRNGQEIFSLPRVAAIRSLVMNHSIHHRGQLSVYLRLNDLPVPSIYGPSADEGRM
ncbi:MAG TPA: DinB family protein [Vicinamibacterales bacterium]|nr:DinB family protein [Vicinamibacterales bacterium]